MFQVCPRIVPLIFSGTILFPGGLQAGGQKRKGAAEHCCRTAPGVKSCRAFPPCGSAEQVHLLCSRSLRRLTIEVWHQTSGRKGSNFLREVQVGFHLAPADKAGKALAAAVDPAGKLAADGRVFGVGLEEIINSFNFINQIVRKILSL